MQAYICKIVRNLSLKRYYQKKAAKRSGAFEISMQELEEYLSAPNTVEAEIEAKELVCIIESFLDTLFAFVQDKLDFAGLYSNYAFEMKINSIEIKSDERNVKTTNGKWKFSASAKSNTDDVVIYEINEEVNGHTIDKIVVTPVMITVYTSYPDLYSGTTRYAKLIFGRG